MNKREMLLLFSIIVAIFFCFGIGVRAAIEEGKEWEAFKVSHKCKVVGKEKGHLNTGIMPMVGKNGGTGVIISSTPDKTGWLCDDGVTYRR